MRLSLSLSVLSPFSFFHVSCLLAVATDVFVTLVAQCRCERCKYQEDSADVLFCFVEVY